MASARTQSSASKADVEVAENLANILGDVVTQYGGGFEKVADAPLQRSPNAARYATYATARAR
ncbi:hypothetical protein ADK54_09790 [Streptomyces sp. WM6378]|nr:hypothetical protein ADK54_09790 [Streptomyces sp. WM6378]